MSLETRVIELLATHLRKSPSDISLTSHFLNDLEMDSLDQTEALLCIEEEFDVDIPNGQMEDLVTPQLVVDYLKSRGIR